MKTFFILLFCLLGIIKVNGQLTRIPKALPTYPKLYDSITGSRFLLNASRTVVTAMDKHGKILWKIDPWKELNLFDSTQQHPRILHFFISLDKSLLNRTIYIDYPGTLLGSGYLDMRTGRFSSWK